MGTDKSKNRDVADSLDADERLLPFLPALLEDLWALGFTPEPMLRLLKRCDFTTCRELRVLDLGCGKGAGLIRLAQEFGWYGDGVGLVPEFIEDARAHAAQCGVSDRVHFEVADIAQAVHQGDEIDLILFGFDADGLGTLEQSLTAVRRRLARAGHVVLDTTWTRGKESRPGVALSEAETRSAVLNTGFAVVDEEILDPKWIRAQNHANTERIRTRAHELGRRHPDKAAWFDDYVRRQEEECRQLEQELVCAILVLGAE